VNSIRTVALLTVVACNSVAVGSVAAQQAPPNGKPVLSAPAIRSIAVGERVQLDLSFAGADFVNWQALGCDYEVDRLFGTDPTKVSLKFSASTPGIYYVLATAANKAGIATAVVTISVRPYLPPAPGPTPDPTPPKPPEPIPPADPLAAALTKAFLLEAAADKANIGKLAQLYTQSAALANDPKQTTAGQLHDLLKAARIALIGETLPNVRAVIMSDLNGVLPTATTAPLDAATRAKAAAEFVRLGALLGGLK
jgi:hypothetical protein